MPISNLLTRKYTKEIMIINFFRVMGGFVICFSFEASNFEINDTLSIIEWEYTKNDRIGA